MLKEMKFGINFGLKTWELRPLPSVVAKGFTFAIGATIVSHTARSSPSATRASAAASCSSAGCARPPSSRRAAAAATRAAALRTRAGSQGSTSLRSAAAQSQSDKKHRRSAAAQSPSDKNRQLQLANRFRPSRSTRKTRRCKDPICLRPLYSPLPCYPLLKPVRKRQRRKAK